MKRSGQMLLLVAALCGWISPAWAARQYSWSQVSPTAPGQFDMGSTQTLTMRVTNTSTGTNTGERIYEVRFRLSGTCTGSPCTATLFSNSTAAPAGWTRSSFSTTSVTFRATSWANALMVGGPSMDFSLVMVAGTSTQDRNETLRDMRARFTLDTNFSNGITRSGTVTTNSPGSWTLKSLQITSFQTTDTSGNPVSAVAAGATFQVRITVRNLSTATQSNIVANPSPPTATKTGSWPVPPNPNPNCSLTSTSPSPFTLTAGASGTMIYTCTTGSGTSGNVTFSVTNVRTSSGSATSRSASSNTLSVSPLVAGMAIRGPVVADSTCLFADDTASFVMTLTNNTGSNVTGITTSVLTITTANGASVGAISGPTASGTCPASLANLASCTFTWTAPVSVTGNYPAAPSKPTITVSATATGTVGAASITSPVASDNEDVEEFVVSVAPTNVNASSTNVELDWTVENRGCAGVTQVEIRSPLPSGWTASGDSYSLVNGTVETWTASGTTFTADAVANRLAIDNSGEYSLVFSALPASATSSVFTVRVTDANGTVRDRATTVTVDPFAADTTTRGIWREGFR